MTQLTLFDPFLWTTLPEAAEEIKEQIVHNAELLDRIENEIKEGVKQ